MHNSTPEVLPPAVALRAISKRFGAVLANDRVDLTVAAADIHGLVGENGAGKSTLMSILYGFYTADSGEIQIHGKTITIANATQAIAAGIGMVHQHFMLVEKLSALDNILLGAEAGFFLNTARVRARAHLEQLMLQHHLRLDLDKTVEHMPVGAQQRLEILKALYRGARILILDEPTAVLTPIEVEHFFALLRQLQNQGVTIILITHKLEEIMRISNRVTVMRAGRAVANALTQETSPKALAEAMVGRVVNLPATHTRAESKPPGTFVRLAVEGLRYLDSDNVVRVDNVSFELAAGEILGVAGVSGNGQTELLGLLAGLLKPESGVMKVTRRTRTRRSKVYIFKGKYWMRASVLRRLGIAFIPEDRLGEGLIKEFSLQESGILGYQTQSRFGSWCHLRPRSVKRFAQLLIKKFNVRPSLPGIKSANLSGGNQQKLILAREMEQFPRILLVGQPTRGVDIGAMEYIYHALLAARDAGAAILLVSVELEEIFALSDRILVMNQGRVQGICPGGGKTSAADIGLLMGGAATQTPAANHGTSTLV